MLQYALLLIALVGGGCARGASTELAALRSEQAATKQQVETLKSEIGGILMAVDDLLKNHSAQIGQLQKLVELQGADPRAEFARQQIEEMKMQLKTLSRDVELLKNRAGAPGK